MTGANQLKDSRVTAACARALARSSRWEQLLERAGNHLFTATTVTKTMNRKDLIPESERTRIAHSLGATSQLFYTPDVEAIDEYRCSITFERIIDFVTFRDLFREDAETCAGIANRVGQALGYIHRHFAENLPEALASSPLLRVHGDFNTMNVGLRPSDGALVVLDWSPGRHFERLRIRDPELFEVSHFIYSLVAHHHAPWTIAHTLPRIIDEFLEGYEARRGRTLPRSQIQNQALWISRRLFFEIPPGRPQRALGYLFVRVASHLTLAFPRTFRRSEHE